MTKNIKIAISSWIYAIVYLLWGVLLYIMVPKFAEVLREMKISLPLSRSMIVSSPSIIWLLVCFVIATLVLLRDLSGKRSLFPNWAALTILVISIVYFAWALFTPIFVCGAPNT